MKRCLKILFLMVFACGWLPFPVAGPEQVRGENPQPAVLIQQIRKMNLLRAELSGRIRSATVIRALLTARTREYETEIESGIAHFGFSSYTEAQEDLRTRFNLKLIQLAQAYIDALNQKIALYRIGSDHLTYLIEQAEDELRLLQALDAVRSDDLIQQINAALERYRPEIKNDMVVSAKMTLTPCETIWQRLHSRNR